MNEGLGGSAVFGIAGGLLLLAVLFWQERSGEQVHGKTLFLMAGWSMLVLGAVALLAVALGVPSPRR